MRHLTLVACVALNLSAPLTDAADPDASDPEQSFRQRIQPLLARLCYECHGNGESQGDLSLEPFTTARSLATAPQTGSLLAQKLAIKAMPPEEAAQPTDDERRLLIAAIRDAVDSLDCDLEARPGRVTIRRLNRFEYRNTIRDLLAVEYQPADDFPADEVGYGFDHIGDVLSLPPVLMEKYFQAAGEIAPQVRVSAGDEDLLVARLRGDQLATGPGGKYRSGGNILSSTGVISTAIELPAEGLYEISTYAFGQQAGNESVQMGLRFDGAQIATATVEAQETRPGLFRHLVRTGAGKHELGLAFLNDFYSPEADRNLIVHRVEIRGPLQDDYTLAPEAQTQSAAATILGGLAQRAFRRPVTPPELERLLKLYNLARSQGDSFEASVQFTVQALLISPHFLFRVESDPAEGQPARRLNDFELATRLSYFLWSSMPDPILFTLAEKGALQIDGVLEGQVLRMLRDPKAQALATNFAGQWLNLRKLAEVDPDPARFPDFDEPLRQAMVTETELFFAEVMRRDRSILDLLDARFTYVNKRLARHYQLEGIQGQLEGIQGDQFRRVQLTGDRRGGLLTHASILTLTSNPTRTSPVKRGKWILENLLGTPPPDPPPGVEELAEDEQAAATGSLRERMIAHREKPICASCHQLMDPLGFGFENFDAIGAWRDRDGDFPVESAGTLPSGEQFAHPQALSRLLRSSRGEQFSRCLTEKMLTYALGRGLEFYDRCAVDEITKSIADRGHRFSRLIVEVVKTEAFQYREPP